MINRVVVDTNLWISFLITRKYSFLETLINSNKIKLLFSSELLTEFIEVAKRPKFKSYFNESDLDRILQFMKEFSELIEIQSDVHLCRDENDDFLINLCIDGHANYLLTGDHDLLSIGAINNTKIVSYGDFMEEMSLH